MKTGPTDMEIISIVLKGDQTAYAQLVDRYQNYVFTLVLRLVESREDAEELAQDVFIKAYRCLSDFRGEAKFSTWLYTITRTSCLSFLRKKKIPVTTLDNENTYLQAENQQSAFQADRIEQKSRQSMVHEAIRMLPPGDAEIITLFYQAEQSLEEIGVILGLEPNNVKVKLFRARSRLKEKMQKYYRHEISELQKGGEINR